MKFYQIAIGLCWLLVVGCRNVDDPGSGIDTESLPTDTADGLGGPDEECYSRGEGADRLVWCDYTDMVAQACADNELGCCCRESCTPASCDAMGEAAGPPCIHFGSPDASGYCDYQVDLAPVTYSCDETCTPRSQCDSVDAATGECLVPKPDGSDGLCLTAATGDAEVTYCNVGCTLTECGEAHLCLPLTNDSNEYDGTGACVPRAAFSTSP